jgi:hypothetical protein
MTERDQAAADAMVRLRVAPSPGVVSPEAGHDAGDASAEAAGGPAMQGTFETTGNVGQTGSAFSSHGDTRGLAQYRGVAEQIIDEMRHAAESLIDEQRARAAQTVHGVADALRQTADTLTRENNSLAHYADRAAERIDMFGTRFREQRWSDVVAEAEAIAHRQPMLFLAGAIAMGFVAGRFISATDPERKDGTTASGRPATVMASIPRGMP